MIYLGETKKVKKVNVKLIKGLEHRRQKNIPLRAQVALK